MLFLPLLCAIVLWACASDSAGDASGSDEFTLPTESGLPKSAAASSPSGSATVSGHLGFDDIEGGCSFIESADGTRYEVVYPDGWMVDRLRAELRARDGRVARAGDVVTVRGEIASDRSSTCQIGPIFVATEVELAAP